jgi:hypothetical protein
MCDKGWVITHLPRGPEAVAGALHPVIQTVKEHGLLLSHGGTQPLLGRCGRKTAHHMRPTNDQQNRQARAVAAKQEACHRGRVIVGVSSWA